MGVSVLISKCALTNAYLSSMSQTVTTDACGNGSNGGNGILGGGGVVVTPGPVGGGRRRRSGGIVTPTKSGVDSFAPPKISVRGTTVQAVRSGLTRATLNLHQATFAVGKRPHCSARQSTTSMVGKVPGAGQQNLQFLVVIARKFQQ